MLEHTVSLRAAGQAFQGAPTLDVFVGNQKIISNASVSADFSKGQWQDILRLGHCGQTAPFR